MEFEELLQEITIYHKEKNSYVRYNKTASLRNTSIYNRNKNGIETSDNGLIRVFDTLGYNSTWKCEKGDIIVAMGVSDDVKAPLTELRKKYGKQFVYEVSSIDIFDFKDDRVKELNHIKIGIR